MLHSRFWRSASAYVALTRQRLGATVFAAKETAADLRQLAWQIGRTETKAASLAYATPDEITPERRRSLSACPTIIESAREEVVPGGHDERLSAGELASGPAVLIPAFFRREHDSLGRGLDAASLAAVVASDAGVIRARAERATYLRSAYRDPEAAMQRLEALLARDGVTRTAHQVEAAPETIGTLRGRTGLFAGASSRGERQIARATVAALGANLTQTAEAEARALRTYHAAVEAQIEADATVIPALSHKAITALKAVMTKENTAMPEEVERETRMFRSAVEARFGAAGVRALLRGEAVDPASVPGMHRPALVALGRLYRAVHRAEVTRTRALTLPSHTRDTGIKL